MKAQKLFLLLIFLALFEQNLNIQMIASDITCSDIYVNDYRQQSEEYLVNNISTTYSLGAYDDIQSVPTAPKLMTPSNNSSQSPEKVDFIWMPATPNVTLYCFELAKTENFANAYVDSSITAVSTSVLNLEGDTKYWWRVKAFNSDGWGPYSAIRTFTTKPSTDVIEKNNAAEQILVYPNPASTTLNIDFGELVNVQCEALIYRIALFDLSGVIVYETFFNYFRELRNILSLELNSLSEGYFSLVIYGNKEIRAIPLVILK